VLKFDLKLEIKLSNKGEEFVTLRLLGTGTCIKKINNYLLIYLSINILHISHTSKHHSITYTT